MCGKEYDAQQRFCPDDGATLKSTNTTKVVGTVIADRYLIAEKLGEGGMGEVFLATHVRMGRKSAVKIMSPEMIQDPIAVSRFNHEASNASQINHPNVAAIYDFGETREGILYLAMEYVEGEPISVLIERSGPFQVARVAEIIRQAASALSAAHTLGIVHRDLKPENVMLGKDHEQRDCVKLVDFGIAKVSRVADQNVTKTGFIIGTPAYMSPEQICGDALDGRSDQYSLALVAFNMLTGTLPFPGASSQEQMLMRLTDRPRTLAEMKGDVPWPKQVQRVFDRALARKADERYESANDFARELGAAVRAMPDRGAGLISAQVAVPPRAPERRESVVPPPLTKPLRAPGSLATPRARIGAAVAAVLVVAAGAFAILRGFGSDASPRGDTGAAVGAEAPTAAARPVATTPDTVASAAALHETAAPATPAASPAQLRLPTSLPREATVWVNDSIAIRRTTSLPAGTYTLRLELPGRAGASEAVTLHAGETRQWPSAPLLRMASTQVAGASTPNDTSTSRANAPSASAAPASSSLVTPPAPAPAPLSAAEQPPDPRTGEAAAKAAVSAVIQRYAAALSSRRIVEVLKVYPTMPENEQRSWRSLLEERENAEVTARASVDEITVNGPLAEARFAMTITIKPRRGQQQSFPPTRYVATLRESDGEWRIVAVKGL
jgi:eukaryotic-like serine/threonine-protein kinase